MPATLPRRLVSIGDDVYVTLGIHAPVSHLKGSDGSVVETFAGSEAVRRSWFTETPFWLCA